MKSYIVKYFLLIFTMGFILSCSKKSVSIPADIIPVKQMEEVMADVHLAEAAKQVPDYNDTARHTISEYYAFILKSHHITKDQFEHSFTFYKSHPELMEEIYSEVINRLSEKQAKQGNH